MASQGQFKNSTGFSDSVRGGVNVIDSELNHNKTYAEQILDEAAKTWMESGYSELSAAEIGNESKGTDSDESDSELDFEGVIEPDYDAPQCMGSIGKEISEDDIEKSDKKGIEATDFYDTGKYEEAINAFTQAILLNPKKAPLFIKRGKCYLTMKKPNACIRDCTRALQINPDSASAFKLRGRSHRLLGNFVEAAEDLRMACRIDYDEEADDWLKEVTPNARKIEERRRKSDRKRFEKEFKETKERTRKLQEELKIRDSERKPEDSEEHTALDLSVLDETVINMLQDLNLRINLRDPEVQGALKDMTEFWPSIFKNLENPKVKSVFVKMAEIFKGKSIEEIEEIAARTKQFAQSILNSDENSSPSETAANHQGF